MTNKSKSSNGTMLLIFLGTCAVICSSIFFFKDACIAYINSPAKSDENESSICQKKGTECTEKDICLDNAQKLFNKCESSWEAASIRSQCFENAKWMMNKCAELSEKPWEKKMFN